MTCFWAVCRRDRRLAIVQLYKALGGGWSLDNARFAEGH